MELEIILHEISQSHNDNHYMFIFHLWNLGQRERDMKFKMVYHEGVWKSKGREKKDNQSMCIHYGNE